MAEIIKLSAPEADVRSETYKDVNLSGITLDGGSGGGEPPVDSETKNYVDAKMESVKAQNDARFAEILARLDGLHPATWWQNALLLAAAIGFVFAILAYASDRFDSGVSAMGAIEERLDAQREINAAQNERLDRILSTIESNAAEANENR